ncbi:MAG TPA: CARDB domain-containing protein [Thermoanaerobaculia bacterium]|nr:CARDB domain-containing protein [Thermoanaerobaculia bacterium]
MSSSLKVILRGAILLLTFSIAFTSSAVAQQSDLIVLSISVNPTSGPVGSGATVNVTLYNQGPGTALQSTTRLRINQSQSNVTTSDPILTEVSAPAINSGQSYSANIGVTIPGNRPTGSNYIWAIADAYNTANQSNINNDRGVTPFTVTGTQQQSDLIVQSISVNPTSGPVGSGATVSVTLYNQGPGTALQSTTRLRINQSQSNVTTSDPILTEVSAPAINSGQSYSANIGVTIPGNRPAGTNYIWAIADAYNTANQSNTNNDRGVTMFTVAGATGAPGNFTLSAKPYCNTSPPPSPAVKLTWSASSNVSNYQVYRNGSPVGGAISSPQQSFDNNGGVLAGQTYSYFILATNPYGTQESNTLQVLVPPDVCGSTASGHTLSGRVTDSSGNGLGGVLLHLALGAEATSHTASDGSYSVSGLANGTYVLTPSLPGYTFLPATLMATIAAHDVSLEDFVGTPYPGDPPLLTIHGPSGGLIDAPLAFAARAINCVPAADGWAWDIAGGSAPAGTHTEGVAVSWSTPGSKRLAVTNSACAGASGKLSIAVVGASAVHLEVLDPNYKNSTLIRGGSIIANPQELAFGAPQSVTGVAADGVTRVLLRADVSGPGTVTFRLGDPKTGRGGTAPNDGGLAQLGGDGRAGSVVVAATKVQGAYLAYAIFRAPDDYDLDGSHSQEIFRNLALKAEFASASGGGPAADTAFLSLVRPPVLLLHGIWGSKGTWGSADRHFELLDDPRFRVTPADYSNTNASFFSINAPYAGLWSELAVGKLRFKSIAATQADVVAHSMGGILARIWSGSTGYKRNDNFGAGDIHKLITLDTPTLGTPLAEFLRHSPKHDCLEKEAFAAGKSTSDGALDDLVPGSDALIHLPPSLVPTHALVGIGGGNHESREACPDWPEFFLEAGISFCLGRAVSTDSVLAQVFGSERHDAVVGEVSQGAAVSAEAISPPIGGPDGVHVCNATSAAYSREVARLLDLPVTSLEFAAVSPQQAAATRPSRRWSADSSAIGRTLGQSGGLQIVSPSPGTTVASGESVHVVVMPQVGLAVDSVLLAGPGLAQLQPSAPFVFDVTIPPELAGTINLTALAVDAGGVLVSSLPLPLLVRPAATLQSLQLLPPELSLAGTGASVRPQVYGQFSDGYSRRLTGPGLGTEFLTSTPAIATATSDGVITGVSPGATTLKVRMGAVEATGTVTVESGCVHDPSALCLNGSRFRVRVHWSNPGDGSSGTGTPIALTGDTGYFWFFGSSNVELIVKVLDGTAVNQHFWVFYGALSDVQYTLSVVDTKTGAAKSYHNPPGRLASVADTEAFSSTGTGATSGPGSSSALPSWSAAGHSVLPIQPTRERPDQSIPLASSSCASGAMNLCLSGSRFTVSVTWQDPTSGTSETAQAVPLTDDTGYFWFFGAENVELVVKVLDGRPVNGKYWVFYGALSDIEYTVTVMDTLTGRTKSYKNPAHTLASHADTEAF